MDSLDYYLYNFYRIYSQPIILFTFFEIILHALFKFLFKRKVYVIVLSGKPICFATDRR